MVSANNEVAAQLARYLGPHTARSAMKTFCQKALGYAPDALQPEDVPRLLEAMRPMLRTLLGHESAEAVVRLIGRGFSP